MECLSFFGSDLPDELNRKLLRHLAHDNHGVVMIYLRLLVGTSHFRGLTWEGFHSLYQNHLVSLTIPPLLCNYDRPEACRHLSNPSFFDTPDRAGDFYINREEAQNEWILACLCTLVRGQGTTTLVIQFSLYSSPIQLITM